MAPLDKKSPSLEHHPTTNFFLQKIKSFIVFIVYAIVGKK